MFDFVLLYSLILSFRRNYYFFPWNIISCCGSALEISLTFTFYSHLLGIQSIMKKKPKNIENTNNSWLSKQSAHKK